MWGQKGNARKKKNREENHTSSNETARRCFSKELNKSDKSDERNDPGKGVPFNMVTVVQSDSDYMFDESALGGESTNFFERFSRNAE